MLKPYRLLVCGDRHWSDQEFIEALLVKEPPSRISVLIEGEARGADWLASADWLARRAAEKLGIPVLPFPAKWNVYGGAAGAMRNAQMLEEGKPDLVWAFHDRIADSSGTKDMLLRAVTAGVWCVLFKHTAPPRTLLKDRRDFKRLLHPRPPIDRSLW